MSGDGPAPAGSPASGIPAEIPAAERRRFVNRLKSFEGKTAGPPRYAQDPVNQPMIRHWVEAMGDCNPIYVDDEAAAATVHHGIVAPPTMLQAWGMKGLRATLSPPPAQSTPLDELTALLDGAGFTSVVATNCEQSYSRYLRPGDDLVSTTAIDSISDEKRTALGAGHFVTTRTQYTTAGGEPVGTMTFRILKFRPKAAGA